jgi:hypothetical protein
MTLSQSKYWGGTHTHTGSLPVGFFASYIFHRENTDSNNNFIFVKTNFFVVPPLICDFIFFSLLRVEVGSGLVPIPEPVENPNTDARHTLKK